METVIIVIHLMVIIALVAVVLMQRSEGGALGIGGGGNFMSVRGTGNVLTRTTAILAAAFFATSIILTVMTRFADRPASILDNVPAANTTAPAPVGRQRGRIGARPARPDGACAGIDGAARHDRAGGHRAASSTVRGGFPCPLRPGAIETSAGTAAFSGLWSDFAPRIQPGTG